MISDVLRDINLFVDGRGHAGQIEELNPPKLTIKTEEHRMGGMDAPVQLDMGMEKLECNFSLASVDADTLKLWGLAQGNQPALTFRGALQGRDGTVKAAVIRTRGQIKEVDYGTWKPGEKATLKFMCAVDYYKLEIDGETIHEIDIENYKRIVNGVDQLASRRAALGL